MTEIPSIDLADLHTADGLKRVSGDMTSAYRQWGFAYLVNHGVPRSVITGIMSASRQFHALPLETKRAITVNHAHRGFLELASSIDRASSIESAQFPNHSESFIKLHDLNPEQLSSQVGQPLIGPNQWPEDAPGFKEVVQEYDHHMEVLARRLVQAMAVAFGLPETGLDKHFVNPTTWLRLLHYPPRPSDADARLFGSAPHTDYGCLTLLYQDNAGGLQVRAPGGGWLDVPPKENTFVMNTGDIVPVWSGGQWRSTPHRAYNPDGVDRYSVPYFFDPGLDARIAPQIPSRDGHAVAAPFLFGDHVTSQLNATYDYRDTE